MGRGQAQRVERTGNQQRCGLRGHQADPAVVAGQRAGARPDHFAARAQLIQLGGHVVTHARRQDERLQRARRNGCPGQLLDGAGERVGPAPGGAAGPLPVGKEAGEGARRHRLDLTAQLRQTAPAQHAQHLGVTPLATRPARPELPGQDAPSRRQPVERTGHERGAEAVARGDVRSHERPVRAGESADEIPERIVDGLEEDLGDTDRHRDAERVTQPSGVFDGDPSLLARDPHAQTRGGPPPNRPATPRRCWPRRPSAAP